MLVDKQGKVGTVRPFDESGITRRADGVLAYIDLDASLVTMLDRARREFSSRQAVVEPGAGSATYAQLWRRATEVAGGLHAAGIARGDRVALSLVNGLDWVVTFFGIVLAGATVVPVNFRLTTDEIGYILDDSGAALHIDDPRAIPTGSPRHVDDVEADELAAIFYTSGTTGRPKGAMTTHRNLLSINETIRRINSFLPDEEIRTLVSVPLFHVTGCNAQLLPALSAGAQTIVLPRFDIGSYVQAIEQHQANLLVAVPAIYAQLIRDQRFIDLDRSHLVRVLYGGAPMAPEIIARLRELMPDARLGNGYGLSETSSVSTRLPDDMCGLRPESVGFATPVVELDILEPDATGAGELLIRGENVVKGYWGQPQTWADSTRDGWFRTGDVCTLDNEGFCTLLDRRKDMIVRGGENVYSVEVENAIIEHPAVLEVAVLPVPDDIMGERVGAVVVLRPGMQVTYEDVLRTAAEKVAPFKLPEYLDIREQLLPRNPGGKVLKRELRDLDWGPRRRLDNLSRHEGSSNGER